MIAADMALQAMSICWRLRRQSKRWCRRAKRNRRRARPRGALHGFLAERRTAADQGIHPEAVRALRRRLLAGEGPQRRVPARTAHARRASRMARHRHAGGIRRRRSRHHRGRDHDAGDCRVRRRHERRVGDPHQHLRPAARRRIRNRRAEAPHAAAADCRQGQGLLRGDRAQYRARHHAAQGARRPRTATTTCCPARRSGFPPRRSRTRS